VLLFGKEDLVEKPCNQLLIGKDYITRFSGNNSSNAGPACSTVKKRYKYDLLIFLSTSASA
jgi:hypothetical protein